MAFAKPSIAIVSLTAVLVCGLTVGTHAAQPQSFTTGPVSTVRTQESMSAAATKVLHHIVEARHAIHSNEPARAENELHQAFALIDHIKRVRPYTRVMGHIWVAEKHLDYQPPQEVGLDLIPIELSIADLGEIVSARRAKRHLDQARIHLAQGATDPARRELKMLRESLAHTEIDLPLTSTEQHIYKAFALLADGNLAGADEALKDAEAGVQFVSLGGSTPLVKARRALWDAMEDYSAGHHDAVRADLTTALKWLDSIKADPDTKTGREAQRLRNEINELLDKAAHKMPEAESELTGLWHRTVGLVEREAEKLYHAWRDQQAQNHLYRQLIDAKLHLFYAEIELFENQDAKGAGAELERAMGYLQSAASETSGPEKARIEAIEKKLVALGYSVDVRDPKLHDRYDEALADLRKTIKEM